MCKTIRCKNMDLYPDDIGFNPLISFDVVKIISLKHIRPKSLANHLPEL
jgi:hypothetical protein